MPWKQHEVAIKKLKVFDFDYPTFLKQGAVHIVLSHIGKKRKNFNVSKEDNSINNSATTTTTTTTHFLH